MTLKIYLSNGQELELNESYLTSFRYEDLVTNSEEIRIGVAPSATLDFTLINRDNVLSSKKFENCMVEYYNDNKEKIATFDCSDLKKNKKSIDFEMVDKMMRFEVDWRGTTFPITTYNLLLNICNQCGISLRTLKNEIINSDLTIDNEDGLAGETCRTILKYLCDIFGSYANMDKDGNLTIEYYDFHNIKDTIRYGNCSFFEIDEKTTRRAGILFKNDKENVQIGDTSSSYIIEDNPIVKQLSESVKKEIGQRIVDRIKYTSLKSGEFTLSRRDLKEGDVIKVIEENGDENICVVSKIVFENLNKMTIFSYGDTQNSKDSTSTSTSSTTGDNESYSTEVYLGRGQNHQRILAKGGTYTICEKLISNVTSFSKVNLSLFINFNYDYIEDKIIYFDIYTNEKLVKSLKYEATQGFNQFSVSFLADVDLDSITNLYSCKITLLDSELITIEPFECQMSFIVKSCKIEDAVATDQYFVEKYKKIDNTIFNQNRFSIKGLYEKITIKIPFYTFDVSLNSDGSVLADWYEDGTLEIYGTGKTKDNKIYEIAYGIFDYDAYENLKYNTLKVYVMGDISLGKAFFKEMTCIEELIITGSSVEIGEQCFCDCLNLTTVTGETSITKVGTRGFTNCDLTGTFDFSNCTDIRDYGFYNNANMDYIKLPIPLKKSTSAGMEYAFAGCVNLDSIIVLDYDLAYTHNLHGTVFQNTQISTFMFLSDVTYAVTGFLKNIATQNPTLYVCHTWEDRYASTISDLEENYGFNIVWYEKEEEQAILETLGGNR